METPPALATEQDKNHNKTPLHVAVLRDRIDVLSVLLDHDLLDHDRSFTNVSGEHPILAPR